MNIYTPEQAAVINAGERLWFCDECGCEVFAIVRSLELGHRGA